MARKLTFRDLRDAKRLAQWKLEQELEERRKQKEAEEKVHEEIKKSYPPNKSITSTLTITKEDE